MTKASDVEKFYAGATLIVALAFSPSLAAPVLPEISSYQTEADGLALTLGGAAQGTLSSAFQPDHHGLSQTLPAASATLLADLERDTDGGMILSLKSAFELYHDRLDSDNYGGDLVQKVYGQIQTGLGSLEVGMNDGVAYTLAVTGPVVDSEADLDNPNATFFRNPDGGAVSTVFSLNSAVESTLNYAKFSYLTPKLFGVQIGVSYTPSAAKYVLPFADTAPRRAGRQENFWETAVRYDDDFGPFTVSLSGGAAFAHADTKTKTTGHEGLTDWSLGGQIAYPLDDATTLSLGGAYRRSNSYAFDIQNILSGGDTRSAHLSGKLERGAWSFGVEYGDGNADGGGDAPTLGLKGYETALGYRFNNNWLASVGWQQLDYSRQSGVFYNGAGRMELDALFLHLHFDTAGATN
ncbi:MAG: hypothetical protein WCD42_04485 [Rhizomicrobium sp.]